jgi:glutathione S-transferase
MENPNKLTVWGVGTTRTMRVHWLMHELDLTYETHKIESRTGETDSIDYVSINPKRKIPTLVDDGLVITESMAIMRHLRRHYDNLGYDSYQRSSQGRAAYDEWASFILMELDATSLYVIRRHKDLSSIYGEAENAITASAEYFERMIESVSNQFEANDFIWGSCFSELDILLTSCLDWATHAGVKIPFVMKDYHASMASRIAYMATKTFNYSNLQILKTN